MDKYLQKVNKTKADLLIERIPIIHKWYLVRKSLDIPNGIKPTRKTHRLLQRAERTHLVGEVMKIKGDFKMNDLVCCITSCMEQEYLIHGKTLASNHSCFVDTICDLKIAFDEEASEVIKKQMILVVNKAADENKFVDLEDFKNKVALHNIEVLARNIKLIKGNFEDDFSLFKTTPRNSKNKKRPIEKNALAQRLNISFKGEGSKKAKTEKTDRSWTHDRIVNHNWSDRSADDFDGSRPKNWKIHNNDHEWCSIPFGGPHPKMEHVFHNGKVDATMMLKHNLATAYAAIDKKKLKMKNKNNN